MSTVKQVTVTIADEAALSNAVPIGGALVAIIMPAAWDTANLTFQVAPYGGGTFANLFDKGGAEVKITEPSGGFDGVRITLKPLDWMIYGLLKVRSGTSASAVNQTTSAVDITLVYREFD